MGTETGTGTETATETVKLNNRTNQRLLRITPNSVNRRSRPMHGVIDGYRLLPLSGKASQKLLVVAAVQDA